MDEGAGTLGSESGSMQYSTARLGSICAAINALFTTSSGNPMSTNCATAAAGGLGGRGGGTKGALGGIGTPKENGLGAVGPLVDCWVRFNASPDASSLDFIAFTRSFIAASNCEDSLRLERLALDKDVVFIFGLDPSDGFSLRGPPPSIGTVLLPFFRGL